MRHDGPVATRILTWNLQGRAAPDLDAVAAEIAAAQPDLVALQEVQRGQARELARRLGWSAVWRCKHWPVVVPPEGLALLTPAPLRDVATAHLAHPWQVWSWRRRIAVRATLDGPDGPLVVVDAHLGAGVAEGERCRQAERTLALLGSAPDARARRCVVGDLNTRPGSDVLATFRAHGLRDAWAEARPGERGPTNWGRAARSEAPTARLDYALVGPELAVVDVVVPAHGEDGFARWGELSDHLPLTVTVAAT